MFWAALRRPLRGRRTGLGQGRVRGSGDGSVCWPYVHEGRRQATPEGSAGPRRPAGRISGARVTPHEPGKNQDSMTYVTALGCDGGWEGGSEGDSGGEGSHHLWGFARAVHGPQSLARVHV